MNIHWDGDKLECVWDRDLRPMHPNDQPFLKLSPLFSFVLVLCTNGTFIIYSPLSLSFFSFLLILFQFWSQYTLRFIIISVSSTFKPPRFLVPCCYLHPIVEKSIPHKSLFPHPPLLHFLPSKHCLPFSFFPQSFVLLYLLSFKVWVFRIWGALNCRASSDLLTWVFIHVIKHAFSRFMRFRLWGFMRWFLLVFFLIALVAVTWHINYFMLWCSFFFFFVCGKKTVKGLCLCLLAIAMH